jgi:sugar O-acyltransferase (sialic acid O-acetyltransferase NeuD family)
MKQIIIACAGGFGWELSEYLRKDIQCGSLSGYSLKGVIDDYTESSARSPIQLPYLGTISDYIPKPEEYIVLAIGSPPSRRAIQGRLKNVGSHFISYIHSSCYVASDAKIGEGVIVCPNCIINSGAVLEDFSVVNVFGSVGHGAHIGEFSVLSPYAALNGDAWVGADCFLGTRATVFPRVSLGDKCVVDSHSYVRASVGDSKIVTIRGSYKVLNNRLG